MIRPMPMLRLTPQATGALQQQLTITTTELHEVMRFRKEFDHQLATPIGQDALRKLHKDTRNAVLLAELIKEAA